MADRVPRLRMFAGCAYVFDNSGSTRLWAAEVTDGRRVELRTDVLPDWFRRSLWDRLPRPGATSGA